MLTALLWLFPVQLRYEYHAIESLYIFGNNLPLFGILFYVWLGILLLLLFSKVKNSEWQRVALVCIFALVVFGFWAINTPTGGHSDEPWNMGHVKYLQETGTIAFAHPIFSYFQFPGLHILAFSISGVCELEIFTTRTLFIVFSSVLFAALSYVLFMKLLKNSYLSSLAVLLIVGNFVSPRDFWPGNLGLLLLICILTLLGRSAGRTRTLDMGTSMALVMIVLFAAFTISYLPGPTCFIFILVGIYLLQSVVKKGGVALPIIVLFAVMFLAWEIYFAFTFFSRLAGYIPALIAGFTTERVGSALTLTNPAPAWASSIKFFWLALTIGFGAILGIWNLVKARKLEPIEVLETGGLLGVIVFALVSFLATPGFDQGMRALSYFILFTIPIMLRFLSRFGRHDELSCQNTLFEDPGGSFNGNEFHRSVANYRSWFKGHVFTLLIILFFVLSLPIFLIRMAPISTNAIYSYECSGGEFIESAYGTEELYLISDIYTTNIYSYYVPEAHFQNLPAPRSEEELFPGMNKTVDLFENYGNAIFVLSERFGQPDHHHQPAIVEPTDPRWVEIINRLAQNNKIYDNAHIIFYER